LPRSLGMPLEVWRPKNSTVPNTRATTPAVAFHCKDELFAVMEGLGGKLGFSHIAYGMNATTPGISGPGSVQTEQHAVLAPLAEAGLTKLEVRTLAKLAGYPLWDRPAAPCLLGARGVWPHCDRARFLPTVERGEESLRKLGTFREFRVRHHGRVGRVEIAAR